MGKFVRADDGAPLFTAHFNPELYFLTFLAATALGLVAAVAPARRAAHLDPAQAIRV
jgi:lipoprotein-releasing system permease protein